MKRTEMVKKGAKQLFVAENAVETALCEVATLANEVGRMRMNGGMSAVVGQDAIDDIADLYKNLAHARRTMVKLHASLDEVKTQMGCGAMMLGNDDGKPHPQDPPTGVLVPIEGGREAA